MGERCHLEIREAKTDPATWDFLCRLVAEYRRQGEPMPEALTEWALDALPGGVGERPKARRRSRLENPFRNEIVVETIKELHDVLGLPYEGYGRSAILAVADRLGLTYDTVDSIYYLQKIELRRSEIRQRLGAIMALSAAERTDEIKAEETALLAENRDLESQYQAAMVASGQDTGLRGGQIVADGATRERMQLRGRARLSEYLMAASRGRMVGGAEAGLQAAATPEGSAGTMTGIPLELWDIPRAPRMEVTSAPGAGNVGVNLDPIRPAVFAQSIAMRLGIDMPRVGSGTRDYQHQHHGGREGQERGIPGHGRRVHRPDRHAEARQRPA